MRAVRRPLAAAGFVALVLTPPIAARAAIPFCSFTTAAVAFGNYDPTSTAASTATGSIAIACLLPTTIKLAISPDASGAFNPRAMTGAGGNLTYLLNTPGGTLWGDGTAGTSTYSATFVVTSAAVPIAGVLKPQQNVSAGAYSGTLTVTATF